MSVFLPGGRVIVKRSLIHTEALSTKSGLVAHSLTLWGVWVPPALRRDVFPTLLAAADCPSAPLPPTHSFPCGGRSTRRMHSQFPSRSLFLPSGCFPSLVHLVSSLPMVDTTVDIPWGWWLCGSSPVCLPDACWGSLEWLNWVRRYLQQHLGPQALSFLAFFL